MKKLITLLSIALISVQMTFSQGYQVGDAAIDFTLKNIDGKMVSLADYNSAQGFIVIFTCNHCPFSIAYEDRIIAVDKKFKAVG